MRFDNQWTQKSALTSNNLSFLTYTGTGSVTNTTANLTATGDGGTIVTFTVGTSSTINGGVGATGITITNPVVNAITTTGKVSLNRFTELSNKKSSEALCIVASLLFFIPQ